MRATLDRNWTTLYVAQKKWLMDFGVVSTPLSCFLGVLRFLRAINTDTTEGWRLGKRGCGRSRCLTEEKERCQTVSWTRTWFFFIPSFFFFFFFIRKMEFHELWSQHSYSLSLWVIAFVRPGTLFLELKITRHCAGSVRRSIFPPVVPLLNKWQIFISCKYVIITMFIIYYSFLF